MSRPVRLSPEEAEQVSRMVDLQPEALAKEFTCSAAEARALQQYVILAVAASFRRERGEPFGAESEQARLLRRCLPPALRLWLPDALRFAA